jgi:aspartyl-tRNA(Asn)/glutamyl-tRNA(Gln) amidotransferase subunit A
LFSLGAAIEQAAPKIELPEPWWRESDGARS